jgi:hypothetical protein
MGRLTKEEKKEVRKSIKDKLKEDFVENKTTWVKSLNEINEFIENQFSSILIVSPFDRDLLFTYDELCKRSLYVIENIKIVNKRDIDPETLSKAITNSVSDIKILELIKYYLESSIITKPTTRKGV